MAGKSFLFAIAFVFFLTHNCNEPLSTENIFTDTKAFCKSVFVCLVLFNWIIAYFAR